MGKYSFITDVMKFSNSSLNTFNACPYGFKLTYIDSEERFGNWFSSYGIFVHLVFEKFFKDELKQEELAKWYEDNYASHVKGSPPMRAEQINANYYDKGLEFFKGFKFDKNLYKVLVIEESFVFEYGNYRFIVKPDLILEENENKKTILFDYKTSKIYKNKKMDLEKLEEYERQLYIYRWGLWASKQIEIDEMKILFIRDNYVHTIIPSIDKQMEINQWVTDTLDIISNENEFKAKPENWFFCSNLCSVASSCSYKLAKSYDL